MKIEIQGCNMLASGENWQYRQIGTLKVFTQTGKVPSIRVIKTIIKLINKSQEWKPR
jgi:hypothetical protein